MFDEEQCVSIKWGTKNREHYIGLGYTYTGLNSGLMVKAKDLTAGSNARIQLVCDYCGNDYNTCYSSYIKGLDKSNKQACPRCAAKKARELDAIKRQNNLYEKVLDFCSSRGYLIKTNKEDVKSARSTIEYFCPIHGLKTGTVDSVGIGHHGCKDCAYEKKGKRLRNKIDKIKQDIESVNGNILLNPEDYVGSLVRNLMIQCSCGNTFITSYTNYTRAGVNCCSYCSAKSSKGEVIIANYLDSISVKYITEKRFEDCRDQRTLPFDFYLPDYNLIIEFDGQHHFYNVFNKNDYEKTKRHDKIKNDYCASHGINILRIPYYEGNNIEFLISEKLKELDPLQAQDIV